jgi:thymidylate kinase
MLITFSGLDGAGKTTLITWLRQELEHSGRRVTVLHLNDHVGVYAWVRALRDRLTGKRRDAVEGPPRMDPLPTRLGRLRDAVVWSKTLRRILYPVDLLAFCVIRIYVEVVRRRILIMDRYFYDRLVDIADKRGGTWLRIFARFTPSPNLAALLEITPEQAFARKGEYTVPYLKRRAAAYDRVFRLVPGALRLGGQDTNSTRQTLADAIHDRLETGGQRLSLLALRLLLEDDAPLPHERDWSKLLAIAEAGGVLVRLADRLARREAPVPSSVADAVARARGRAEHAFDLVQRISASCARLSLPHAFLKFVERYPDCGRDVDFLLCAESPEIDRLMLRGVPALRRARRLPQRLSGSACYLIDGLVLDIAHGRLGRLGEHARFARQLLARACPQPLGDTEITAPTSEDHLILLALQQAFARAAFRIGDVYWTMRTVRDEPLDWDYVAFLAAALGLQPAVGSYLVYVDRLHARLFSRSLLSNDVLARFGIRGSTRLRALLGADAYRFPAARVAGRVYLQQMHSTLKSGRWFSAARLCLLPMLALVTGLRKAA